MTVFPEPVFFFIFSCISRSLRLGIDKHELDSFVIEFFFLNSSLIHVNCVISYALNAFLELVTLEMILEAITQLKNWFLRLNMKLITKIVTNLGIKHCSCVFLMNSYDEWLVWIKEI